MKKTTFKGFKKEDGTIVKSAFIDGYPVGDRLLEDVWFKVSVKEDGTLHVEIADSSREYFESFNAKKWLKAMKDFAELTDLFYELDEGGGEELELLPTEMDKPSSLLKVKSL